jgi:nucleoside-diphosphate-sugar epimerase
LHLSDYLDIQEQPIFFEGLNFASYSNKQILVTGANGFLAKALITFLIAGLERENITGWKLILLSRKWNAEKCGKFAINPKVIFLQYDSEEASKLRPEIIFHFASPSNATKFRDFHELIFTNQILVSRYISRSTQTIFYASSGEVYKGGDSSETTVISRFKNENFREMYPKAKIITEEFLRDKSEKLGFQLVILRYFHTFGPGLDEHDGRAFADFLWGAKRMGEVVLKSDGSQIRTFLFVSDSIRATLMLGNLVRNRIEVINVGSESPVTILHFARLVSDSAGVNLRYAIEGNEKFSHSENDQMIPNVNKLKSYGWYPTITMASGITKSLAWIANNI